MVCLAQEEENRLMSTKNSSTGSDDQFEEWRKDQEVMLKSIHIFGSIFGGLLSSILGTYFGRRLPLIVYCTLDILGWLCLGCADITPFLVAGRLLSGISFSGFLTNIQTFVAE